MTVAPATSNCSTGSSSGAIRLMSPARSPGGGRSKTSQSLPPRRKAAAAVPSGQSKRSARGTPRDKDLPGIGEVSIRTGAEPLETSTGLAPDASPLGTEGNPAATGPAEAEAARSGLALGLTLVLVSVLSYDAALDMHSGQTPNIYELIESELKPHFEALSLCRSTPELRSHPLYRALEPAVSKVLNTPDVGSFATVEAEPKRRYRVLAWNLERGIELEGQLDACRGHPYLQDVDLFLLTETDVGMARSGNRAIAQTMAQELGLHYAFAPCYLNLAKGSGVEYDVSGENHLGLHGNAILSRYPLTNARGIALK
ncbi:MAG: hypothetical protein IH786_01995, partial [Proteobacteria bacterium]|nr:hypothetical protein [Pseudomonadota bacterium]